MDTRLDTPYLALRFGIGLTAALAGADKFFNLWPDSSTSPCGTSRWRLRHSRWHGWRR